MQDICLHRERIHHIPMVEMYSTTLKNIHYWDFTELLPVEIIDH